MADTALGWGILATGGIARAFASPAMNSAGVTLQALEVRRAPMRVAVAVLMFWERWATSRTSGRARTTR